jgi:hypothetical protein
MTRGAVATYLKELRGATRELPRADQRELLAQVKEHLREALGPEASEAEARAALERLGTPASLAADAYAQSPGAPRRLGVLEWGAVLLLPFGSFLFPFVGWFAGVLMLWGSRAWSVHQKLIGTLVVPGGLFTPIVLFAVTGSSCGDSTRFVNGHVIGQTTCSGPSTLAAFGVGVAAVVLLIGPLVSAIWLVTRAGRDPVLA